MEGLSYQERLEKTGLYSLECRRLRRDLIETFKILKELENVKEKKIFTRTIDTPHHPPTRGGATKVI